MNETVFINDFISIGLSDFYKEPHQASFESHIIECLCDIYGKENIKKVYEARDEAGFQNLIFKYGCAKTVYDNFLRDTIKFENFKNENTKDPSVKSDIGSKVEISVITMFLYKCLLLAPSLEEISHFENNLLNNFSIIKWNFNTALNPNRTRDTWEKKKRMLTDNVELVEIKPEYLDEFTYAKFGTSLEDVKKMDYRMVTELNNYIKSKLTVEASSLPKRKEPTTKWAFLNNTVLSTGNGYVDALLIAGIIATEMSIALIYLFLHM